VGSIDRFGQTCNPKVGTPKEVGHYNSLDDILYDMVMSHPGMKQ